MERLGQRRREASRGEVATPRDGCRRESRNLRGARRRRSGRLDRSRGSGFSSTLAPVIGLVKIGYSPRPIVGPTSRPSAFFIMAAWGNSVFSSADTPHEGSAWRLRCRRDRRARRGHARPNWLLAQHRNAVPARHRDFRPSTSHRITIWCFFSSTRGRTEEAVGRNLRERLSVHLSWRRLPAADSVAYVESSFTGCGRSEFSVPRSVGALAAASESETSAPALAPRPHVSARNRTRTCTS